MSLTGNRARAYAGRPSGGTAGPASRVGQGDLRVRLRRGKPVMSSGAPRRGGLCGGAISGHDPHPNPTSPERCCGPEPAEPAGGRWPTGHRTVSRLPLGNAGNTACSPSARIRLMPLEGAPAGSRVRRSRPRTGKPSRRSTAGRTGTSAEILPTYLVSRGLAAARGAARVRRDRGPARHRPDPHRRVEAAATMGAVFEDTFTDAYVVLKATASWSARWYGPAEGAPDPAACAGCRSRSRWWAARGRRKLIERGSARRRSRDH